MDASTDSWLFIWANAAKIILLIFLFALPIYAAISDAASDDGCIMPSFPRRKMRQFWLAALILLVMLSSSEILCRMAMESIVTPDNIETAQNSALEFIEKILGTFKGVAAKAANAS